MTGRMSVAEALDLAARASLPPEALRIIQYVNSVGSEFLTRSQTKDLVLACAAQGCMEAADVLAPAIPMVKATVYRYFDSRGRLLYIGVTERGEQRQREHSGGKAWWPLVASMDAEHFASREEALQREAELIRLLAPPFNTQHSPLHPEAREFARRLFLGKAA